MTLEFEEISEVEATLLMSGKLKLPNGKYIMYNTKSGKDVYLIHMYIVEVESIELIRFQSHFDLHLYKENNDILNDPLYQIYSNAVEGYKMACVSRTPYTSFINFITRTNPELAYKYTLKERLS